MGTCVLCKSRVGFWGKKTLSDGSEVCGTCEKMMPFPFRNEQFTTSAEYEDGFAYAKMIREKVCNVFTATAQYGRMFLDEKHGLIAICDATNIEKDGKLKHLISDIFYCLAIDEPHFTMDPVKNTTSDVTCRVMFRGYLTKYNVKVDTRIKGNVSCHLKRDDQGAATWNEPDDLIVFKNIYNQMVNRELESVHAEEKKKEDARRQEEYKRQKEEQEKRERARKFWEEEAKRRERKRQEQYFEEERRRNESLKNKENETVLKALALFMLEESFTEAELKAQRARLMKVFHPDNANVEDHSYAQKINDAYIVLQKELERRKNE